MKAAHVVEETLLLKQDVGDDLEQTRAYELMQEVLAGQLYGKEIKGFITNLFGSLEGKSEVEKGGPGSGHHGHKGRKGRRGGSTSSGAGAPSAAVDYGDLDVDYESRFWNSNAKRIRNEAKELVVSQDLTPSEEKAVLAYTKKDVYTIQNELRSGKMSPDTERKVKKIDSALEKSAASKDLYVYRSKKAERQTETITEKGYISTSLSKQVAASFAADAFGERNYEDVIRIKVPEGASALYTGVFGGGEAKQFEVLLPRGSVLKQISNKEYELQVS